MFQRAFVDISIFCLFVKGWLSRPVIIL
jgi:hypothetical protein